MVTIRQVQLKRDIEAILESESLIFGDDAFDLSEFLYLYMRGKHTFLVATEGDAFAGYISAYREQQHGYIASIAVHPDHQRRGIGRQLMQRIIDHFVAQPATIALRLHVRCSNQEAIALYQALQFNILTTIKDFYSDEDGYLMQLDLTALNP